MKLSFLIVLFAIATQVLGQKAQAIFVNGEAQIVAAFTDADKWITHDMWVETDFDSDGDGRLDRMHVSVTRPEQTESEGLKLPVIYISSPYFAGVAQGLDNWDVKHELGELTSVPRSSGTAKAMDRRPYISTSHIEKWLPRGYIVVHSSSPGTGFSDGSPTVGGDNESLAPKAVIDWLCGRATAYTERRGSETVEAFWSTGKVGMTGTSYNGTIPLAAATTGVEGLEAIIPVAPNTSYYHYYRCNGLVRSPGGYLGEDIDVLYDFIHTGDTARRAHNNAVVRDGIMKAGMDRESGDYNDFWAGRDYLNDMAPMKAALLMSHGLNDWNVMPEHSYRIYNKAREMGIAHQIYYHQNGHGGPPPLTLMNRWFTHYLHGVDNGVEKDAKAWIVREHDSKLLPTPYVDFPNPGASDVELYLKGGAPALGVLCVEKETKQGVETLVDNYSFAGAVLAQAENTEHRLLYVSKTLCEDLHISGTATITIKAASSKPAVNLSVWLVSLPWNGAHDAKITDNIITRGWADLQNHSSLTDGTALKPGKFYDMTFSLNPDDQIIAKGQQIGLLIFSSDKEFTLWPEPGTELSVDVDGTSITLPIVGGKNALMKAISDHK